MPCPLPSAQARARGKRRDGMDKKLEKWRRWLKPIENDIVSLLMNREIFWGIQDIIGENRYEEIKTRGHVYRYIKRTYVAYMAIGIRRQIKVKDKPISFLRLLTEIKENPQTLSRESYVSLCKGTNAESFADQWFDKLCGDNKAYISPDMVVSDIDELKKIVSKVETFADRRVAHYDGRNVDSPDFQNLDESLDKIWEIYKKYLAALTVTGVSITPLSRQCNWKKIFTVPWIKSVEATSGENG